MSKEKFATALARLENTARAKLVRPINEALWARAKAQADSIGSTNHWSYIIQLYHSYGGLIL